MAQWVVDWASGRGQQKSNAHIIYRLIYVFLLLMIIGSVAVESASYPLTSAPSGAGAFHYLIAHLEGVLLSIVIMIAMWFVPVGWLPAIGAAIYGLFMVSMVRAAASGGYQGNASWDTFAGMRFQPSEIAKVGFIMLSAWLLGRRPLKGFSQPEVVWFFVLAAAMLAVLMAQHDMGMMALLSAIMLMMLYLADFPIQKWILTFTTVAVAGVLGILAEDYRVVRIKAWLHPEGYLDGPGYHIMNSLIAIARGAVWGLGIGRSPDKWASLPYPHTDSVFCVIAAETGLWGTGLLLAAFGGLAVFSFMAASGTRTRMQWLLASGCGLAICLQAALQMAIATNLAPPAGLTLPFISFGRSSLFASAIAAGVVLRIARETNVREVSPELT
jgi:cell division protein FtsW